MKKSLIMTVVSAAAFVAFSAASQAAFTVSVSDGNTVRNFSSNGQTLTGSGAFTYSNNSFLFFTISASTNSPGVNGIGQVTNQTISFYRGGTGTLGSQTISIVANSTGFDLGGAASGAVTTNFSSGVLSGSATGFSTINTNEVSGSGLNLTGHNQDRSSTVQTSFGSTPFSIGNTMNITLNPRGLTNTALATVEIETIVSGDVMTAPAPSALLLAAFGLPAFGLVRRWSRKSAQTAESAIAA